MTLLLPAPPSRDQLVEHLRRTRIAGDVATARASNLANINKMLARDPDYWFGLELDRPWSFDEVLAVMVERVGISADPTREGGADTIDPDRCVRALDAAAERLSHVVAERGSVLVATGHPTGLLALYLPLVAALAAAGCEVVTPLAESWVGVQGQRRRIRYVGDVATLGTGGDLLHTHSPEPMQAVVAAMTAPPDLVIADHGWAGAAAQAGLRTVGLADTNDPAMFIGAEEGKVVVAVPLDDNVAPSAYDALAAYVLKALRPT